MAIAASHATGLELARSGAFHLVLLDLMILGLNSGVDAKLTRTRLNSSVLWIAGFLSKPRPDERRAGRAAVLAAQVAGCSRLMGEDRRAPAPRAIRRELGDPKIGCRPPTLPSGCCAAANSIANG